MTTPFRALFCDLRTDDIIDSFPLDDVRFADRIGGGGALRGRIGLPDDAAARRADALVPARTAVWIQRDGEIWWGGVVWRTTRHSGPGPEVLEFAAGGWDSYLDRRILLAGLEPGEPLDQLDLARELVDRAQAEPYGDIGIGTGAGPGGSTSGVARQVAYADFDLVRIGDALRGLAAQRDGFEWYIASGREPVTGYRTKRLDLGYPVLASELPDLVLDGPGAVLGYAYTHDGTRRATAWRSRGARVGSGRLMSHIWEVTDVVAADLSWPRLDGSSDVLGSGRREELDTAAKDALRAAWTEPTELDVTVRLDARLSPAPSLLGRHVRLRLAEQWHDGGLDRRLRIVATALATPDGDGAETIRLTLAPAA
ncbi:hypothetical protein [Yinghuangia soli]|uniref:Minor tail protein n=1 Tax=Yinghuangia soli TaxID=2908204 RepID=A0AA41Q473_9ACTN|nr:hypothetical protein [Yinghuangia soli]MCF2530675.1 hypothetical protein [Yinghuangia soli]